MLNCCVPHMPHMALPPPTAHVPTCSTRAYSHACACTHADTMHACRAFLASLAAANDRPGGGVREYVASLQQLQPQQPGASSSAAGGGEVRDAYNAAIEELERFRSLHKGFAFNYIAKVRVCVHLCERVGVGVQDCTGLCTMDPRSTLWPPPCECKLPPPSLHVCCCHLPSLRHAAPPCLAALYPSRPTRSSWPSADPPAVGSRPLCLTPPPPGRACTAAGCGRDQRHRRQRVHAGAGRLQGHHGQALPVTD